MGNISAATEHGEPDKTSHLNTVVTEIVDIYRCLYPVQNLHFFFYEGLNPVWGEPTVVEGDIKVGPEHLSAEYIGQLEIDGAYDGSQKISIFISIPRAPTPLEVQQSEPDWRPIRSLKTLYQISPLLYEQVRFWVEMRRKKPHLHSHAVLPFSKGSSALKKPVPPASSARPAILIAMHWLEIGGAEKLAFDTVHWALEAGLRVYVTAGVASLQRLASKLPDHPDVVFIRLDRYLPHHLWAQYLENFVLNEKIELIHIHHCQVMYDALPQIRIKAPWVKVIDSTHIVEYYNGGFPRISGVWSNYIDVHHVISRELVDYYQEKFHVLESKVVLGRMLENNKQRMPSRANFQIQQKKIHINFIGRLYYQKRPIVLVETLRSLARWAQKNGVDIQGTVVGEGPFRSYVTQLLKRYGLLHMFSVEAANYDIPALLDRSDILLLPSNNEGLALVCYEAVEHGCIPISTDVGSQREIVPADLLLPLSPRACIRRTVQIVDKLWHDEAFLSSQKDALLAAWSRLAADPTAKDVLMPHYKAAATITHDQ